MKEILDEEIKERIVIPPKVLPKYMVRWHWVLVSLLLLNILVESYTFDVVLFCQGLLLPYAFILIISVLRVLSGKINGLLLVCFHLLCLTSLGIGLFLLGSRVFELALGGIGTLAS